MAGFISKLGRSRVRLRLVISLPLLVLLVSVATTVTILRITSAELSERATNHHLAVAAAMKSAAEREMEMSGEDIFGALGTQVGSHENNRQERGVRFILLRTPPAGPFRPYDPRGEITLEDQTMLLTLTGELSPPRIVRIGREDRSHLVTVFGPIENGYFLVALEPFRNMRDVGRLILLVMSAATLFTTLSLLGVALVITAPLHRLAERTKELVRQELFDPSAVDDILEKIQEPEEVAALTLALEQALNALVNLKRSIHGIIESMEGGILATDAEGRIENVNTAAREIMGLEGPLIGKHVLRIVPSPEENRAFLSILERLIDNQVSYGRTREIQFRNGRGETVQLGIATSLVPGEGGGILNAIVVMVDLTEMIELREQLRRADRMSSLGSMATKVAHEIRNPLGSVKGLGQLVLESVDKGGETYRYVERIVREVDRLSSIVEELLDYSQRRPLSFESVDINEVIKESLEIARFREGDRGPTLLQELDLSLPEVQIDRNRMLQAFLNIVVNALQAVGHNGAITVTTFEEAVSRGKRVVIEISDNGSGIEPDVLEHIFDPFYTTKENGSGLGLSIAHTIVREHQGTLEVDSKLGQGTTFRIVLPRFPRGEVISE